MPCITGGDVEWGWGDLRVKITIEEKKNYYKNYQKKIF
jgi:hypothetical protein